MIWQDLFSTDIGLLSLFTIGFVLVIGVYIGRFVKRNMEHDERVARR